MAGRHRARPLWARLIDRVRDRVRAWLAPQLAAAPEDVTLGRSEARQ